MLNFFIDTGKYPLLPFPEDAHAVTIFFNYMHLHFETFVLQIYPGWNSRETATKD